MYHGLDRVTLPVDQGFAAALAAHRAPIALSTGSANRSTFKVFDEWSTDPGETFACVPFMSHSWLMGAITIHHRKSRPYSGHELKLLSTIGFLLGAELGITKLEKENLELQVDLETRKLVERSKGILQRELGLSEQGAYLALQRQSEQKKRPMKEIAQAIILSAEVRQSVGKN